MLRAKSQTWSDYDFQAVGRDVDIVRLADRVLERAPDGMGRHPRYVCSCCDSGRKRGARSTRGCMPSAYGNFLHCFSCNTNAGWIDLAKRGTGSDNPREWVEFVCEASNLGDSDRYLKDGEARDGRAGHEGVASGCHGARTDFGATAEGMRRGRGALDDTVRRVWTPAGRPAFDYVRSRGLTDDKIRLFRLGFQDRGSGERLVILWSSRGDEWHGVARAIPGRCDERNKHLLTAGADAASLGGTANVRKMADVLRGPGWQGARMICLDSDGAGPNDLMARSWLARARRHPTSSTLSSGRSRGSRPCA